jgi:hypothetical protein
MAFMEINPVHRDSWSFLRFGESRLNALIAFLKPGMLELSKIYKESFP